MRYSKLFAFIGLCILGPAHAALLAPDLSDLNTLPVHAVAAPLVSKAISTVASKTEPLQFAVSMALPLTLNDGQWQQTGETSRWRTRIKSQGAQTLNFTFSKFRMPEGATLWIYDASGELVQGPFTHANETPEGMLWTPVVAGGDAIIELRVPTAQRDAVALQLATVNHGFRGFEKATSVPSKAGACEIDVVCPAGDAWRNEIRSVARISIGGTTLCSGQLLNNVQQDDTPYFLTANHCKIGSTPILTSPASSVVFYWNYQTSVCAGARDGSLSQTTTGSTLIGGDTNSDYTLVQVSAAPSASYNVYLAGWNAGGAAVATPSNPGAVIHHPNGDQKSISLFTSSGTPQAIVLCDSPLVAGICTPGSSRNVSAWKITYSQGVTEPGSSGGGLWDANHQIVGQLSGGGSSCSSPTSPDYYGRFDLAFTANSNQLKNVLDPGSTGATSLCGKDPGAGSCQTKSGSSTTVTPVTSGSAAAASGGGGGGGGGSLSPFLLLGLVGLGLLRKKHPRS